MTKFKHQDNQERVSVEQVNGASHTEIIVEALLRCGYTAKTAWRIAENDKYAFDFYMDLIHLRERIYDYQMQRISYVELVGTTVVFCLKNLRRAWLGSIISKEILNLDSLDKITGIDKLEDNGLEPMTFWLPARFT